MNKLFTSLIVLSMACSLQVANAYQLKSLDEPIPAISGVLINDSDVKPGADFHASLSEPVKYHGSVIPEGTQFVGHVDNLRLYKRLHRLSTMDVWIDQVVFPSGNSYTIYPHEQRHPNFRFKPRFWSGKPDTLLDAGNQIYLEFNPATMMGLLQAGMQPPSNNTFVE